MGGRSLRPVVAVEGTKNAGRGIGRGEGGREERLSPRIIRIAGDDDDGGALEKIGGSQQERRLRHGVAGAGESPDKAFAIAAK